MRVRKTIQGTVMLLSLALALTIAPRALADDLNRTSQTTIQVWPEYDKPTVLVLIEGTLADASNLPRDVSVAVPSTATGIIATYANADGTLAAEQTYKSEKQADGFTLLTFSTKSANYHLEYYDDLLRGAPDKTLDFVFKAPAPADKLTLEIQQPLQASNFVVNPAASTTRVEGGFTIYTQSYSNVTAGQLIKEQVQYTKSDPKPSVDPSAVAAAQQAAQPSAPVTSPASAPSSSGWTSLYVVIGLVVLGSAAVLGWFLFLKGDRRPVPVPIPARRSRRGRGARSAGVGYCTQCGRKLTPEDNFCRGCGAKRRAT